MPTNKGSFKIFTLAGISVYVHWSWFLVAVYCIQYRTHEYSSMLGNVAEYLSLFFIVLAHEFGHQLACRQAGGKTHDIVLWPLGGVAYVSPPQRPGAQLWSIAAGPLVNAILTPVLFALLTTGSHFGWPDGRSDAYELLRNIWYINLGLLVFNLMPIYPLDGGQILRSLLWFLFGRAHSLLIATVVGLIGVAGLIGLAVFLQSIWLGIMAAFILMNCWRGLMHARALARIARIPRREGCACPSCQAAPPLGEHWRCGSCGKAFDTFLTGGVCPQCSTRFSTTQCLDCGAAEPIEKWIPAPK
jgi:Zn-dependent protease